MQTEKERESEETSPAIAAFEAYDEMQISNEMKGGIIEQYFYSFKQGDTQITGLSYTGVRYVASEMGRHGFPITIDSSTVTESEDGESYRAKAVARNITTGVCFPGFAECKKRFQSGAENRFAYVIASSKAERNAMRKHLPEKAITTAYEEWRNRSNGSKNVTPEKVSSAASGNEKEKGKVILGSSGFLDGGK